MGRNRDTREEGKRLLGKLESNSDAGIDTTPLLEVFNRPDRRVRKIDEDLYSSYWEYLKSNHDILGVFSNDPKDPFTKKKRIFYFVFITTALHLLTAALSTEVRANIQDDIDFGIFCREGCKDDNGGVECKKAATIWNKHFFIYEEQSSPESAYQKCYEGRSIDNAEDTRSCIDYCLSDEAFRRPKDLLGNEDTRSLCSAVGEEKNRWLLCTTEDNSELLEIGLIGIVTNLIVAEPLLYVARKQLRDWSSPWVQVPAAIIECFVILLGYMSPLFVKDDGRISSAQEFYTAFFISWLNTQFIKLPIFYWVKWKWLDNRMFDILCCCCFCCCSCCCSPTNSRVKAIEKKFDELGIEKKRAHPGIIKPGHEKEFLEKQKVISGGTGHDVEHGPSA